VAEEYLAEMGRLNIDKLMEGGDMERSRKRVYELLKLEEKA